MKARATQRDFHSVVGRLAVRAQQMLQREETIGSRSNIHGASPIKKPELEVRLQQLRDHVSTACAACRELVLDHPTAFPAAEVLEQLVKAAGMLDRQRFKGIHERTLWAGLVGLSEAESVRPSVYQ
jgi:hypothetical protein